MSKYQPFDVPAPVFQEPREVLGFRTRTNLTSFAQIRPFHDLPILSFGRGREVLNKQTTIGTTCERN